MVCAMLDLRQVLSFVTIAELRSFTRTAEALGIAQSAVSQHIRRLEDQLQLTLLARNSRTVALSADGQGMLVHARALLAAEQSVMAAARAARAVADSTLRIGAYSFAADQRMDAIDAFQKRYPDLRLEIVYGTREELLFKLRDGSLDVFFSLSAPTVAEPDLSVTHVARRYCHIAVPPGHRLAGQEHISIDDLAGEGVAISPGNQDSPVVSLVYADFLAHDARLVPAPEADRRAIARFARSRGLPHLLWLTRQLPRHKDHGEEVHPLHGDAPRIDTVIYSRPGDRRRPVRLILAAFADRDRDR
jgi:DNA-binding transcriptional LysR family regulator